MKLKTILRIPIYLYYYSIIFLGIVLVEWIIRKDLTLKQSIKEFLEVDFFD